MSSFPSFVIGAGIVFSLSGSRVLGRRLATNHASGRMIDACRRRFHQCRRGNLAGVASGPTGQQGGFRMCGFQLGLHRHPRSTPSLAMYVTPQSGVGYAGVYHAMKGSLDSHSGDLAPEGGWHRAPWDEPSGRDSRILGPRRPGELGRVLPSAQYRIEDLFPPFPLSL